MTEPYWEPLAAAPASDFVKLWDSKIAGTVLPVQTITTPVLDQSYTNLRIVAQLLSSLANNGGTLLRFNGDAGANYYFNKFGARGGNNYSDSDGAAAGSMDIGNVGGFMQAMNISIPAYADQLGSGGKAVIANSMFMAALSTTNMYSQIVTGLWQVNQAIQTISIISGNGTWQPGTRICVYGER